jgi:hypothetical protein
MIRLKNTFAPLFAAVIACLIGVTVGLSLSTQALEDESQSYFIKHIKQDRVLMVLPNFLGEYSLKSLLPSLDEISENYTITSTRTLQARKLDGRVMPSLVVYVQPDINAQPESLEIIASNAE